MHGSDHRVAMHRRGQHVQKAHGRRVTMASDSSHLSGCMIALMPTVADAKRLAIKGGEKAEDLHCTLFFVGDDAELWTPEQRQELISSMTMLAQELDGPVSAKVFGVSHWNAGGESPSWVWSVGDAEPEPAVQLGGSLSFAHILATEALEYMHNHPALPAQHTPWVAHICAAYTGDLTLAKELEKRLGEVTFDRIRISFADEDTDIPLTAALTAAAAPLRRNLTPLEEASRWDFAAHQKDWTEAVADALSSWQEVKLSWRREIRQQITSAGGISPQISVDTTAAAETLYHRMLLLAQQAGEAQQREAEEQGVTVPEWTLDSLTAALSGSDILRGVASMRASIMGNRLVQSARSRLAALFGSGRDSEELADDVDGALDELSDASDEEAIGAAMTGAQNTGRMAVLMVAPLGQYVASEALDKNTCKPCISIDGMEFVSRQDAMEAYPSGGSGYAKCQGGSRCRGTLLAVWGGLDDSVTADGGIMSATEALVEEGIMPWHTVQGHSGCPSSEPWAVVKDSDGSVAGCHASEQEANDQLAALYAAESSGEMTTEADLGAKPSEGTKKDKRIKENKYGEEAGVVVTEAEQELTSGPVELEGKTAPWRGPLTVEGIETGDGREFDTDSLTWADLPLPLRWNKEDSHGGEPHTVAVNVGNITKIWREGSLVMGEGLLDLGDEDGQRVHDKIKGQFLRGVSVDVDSIKDADMELVWPDMPDGEGGEEADLFEMLFASPEKIVFHRGRIRAATVVDIPAFAEAYIALLDEEGAVLAGGERIGALRASRTPRPVFTGPVLRASGSGWAPPVTWFQDPALSVPTGITVDNEGRVYGHAALWGTCHIGQAGVCVTPPHEEDHPYFMTGEIVCADDSRVSVGQITVGTGHAPISYNAHAASDHYDNTGAAVADVVVGNDAHGIWVAGAVRPGADSSRVHELRGAGQVSGDWRRIGGQLRLVGLLAVNTPGFPVPKLRTSVKAGSQFALVASGIPHLSNQVREDQLDKWAYARVMDIMRRRVHGEG